MLTKTPNLLLAICASAFLTACGGGGGGSSPTTGPTGLNLTLSGTAATGKAIAGASISAKCQVGTGTATTIADGTYSLVVPSGKLPCILQITNPVDGTKLHTVATGSGSSTIANITPLTEMLTARLLGNEPVVFFATFDAAVAASKVTIATVKVAQTDVATILVGTVDTSSLSDFIATPLHAATSDNLTGGDTQDKMLDALGAKINSSQLTQVVTSLAHTSNTTEVKQVVVNMMAVPPNANAGADQNVLVGKVVTLDSSTSSADVGRALTYAWTLTSKPSGSSAALVSSTSARPTFTVDVAGTYVASVVVNDGRVNSSSDAVSIFATIGSATGAPGAPGAPGPSNAAPVANAGVAQNVMAGSVVTLDGSASSDANSDPLTYAWTLTSKPAGSTAALSSSTSAKPTFTANSAGTYVASLTVNDGKVSSTVATVSITAAVANVAPVANAGVAQNVVAGSAVTLDGSASSDANSDPLTYAWTLTSKPAGSAASLSSATSVKPTFTADLAGTYVASLTVNDGKVNSNLATTSVTAVQARFQAAASGTIVDSLTGLTWMRCAFGQLWTGSTCSGDAATYVQSEIPGLTSGFVYAGISNWRVPTVRELQTIVDLSRFNPSTDPTAFPNTPFTHFRTSSGEWTIGFGDSGTTQASPSAFLAVRLVTSTTTLPVALMRLDRPSGDFADNLNGTVTHPVTGLMWQKCMKGQTFDAVANTCTGIAREYLPSQVQNESFAGYTDWRVPTIEEWINFTDYTKQRPAINSELFQGTPQLTYFFYVMSSSILASDPQQIWTFGVDYGDTQRGTANYGRYVRLVRTIAR